MMGITDLFRGIRARRISVAKCDSCLAFDPLRSYFWYSIFDQCFRPRGLTTKFQNFPQKIIFQRISRIFNNYTLRHCTSRSEPQIKDRVAKITLRSRSKGQLSLFLFAREFSDSVAETNYKNTWYRVPYNKILGLSTKKDNFSSHNFSMTVPGGND